MKEDSKFGIDRSVDSEQWYVPIVCGAGKSNNDMAFFWTILSIEMGLFIVLAFIFSRLIQ